MYSSIHQSVSHIKIYLSESKSSNLFLLYWGAKREYGLLLTSTKKSKLTECNSNINSSIDFVECNIL